jgi:hypothetical protein
MAESIRTDSYRDLKRRGLHPWARRAMLLVLVAAVVLAMAGTFGQRTGAASQARGQAATLTLSGPAHLRGGLYFQAKINVLAHRRLSTPTLVLDGGFLDGLTINTIEPQATQELNRNGRLVLQYGALQGGHRLTVWIEYQVNPTTVGGRTQRVELDDGGTPLAAVTRDFRSFP